MLSVCYPDMPLTGTGTLNEFKGALYTSTYLHLSKQSFTVDLRGDLRSEGIRQTTSPNLD